MMKKILLLLIFSASALFAQSYKDLIGSWQVTNHVAAGYNDAFTFNEDGTFIFHYNQMDCAKREISYGGSWVLDSKKIILTITFREKLSGGKLEPSSGSCAAADYHLVRAGVARSYHDARSGRASGPLRSCGFDSDRGSPRHV